MSFQQPTSYEVRGSDLGIRSGEQSGKHVAKNGSVLPDGCWISELETIETLHQRTDELNWGGGGSAFAINNTQHLCLLRHVGDCLPGACPACYLVLSVLALAPSLPPPREVPQLD